MYIFENLVTSIVIFVHIQGSMSYNIKTAKKQYSLRSKYYRSKKNSSEFCTLPL